MPLYEFECKCGNLFEQYIKLQLFEKEVKCNKCGGFAQLNIKPVKSRVFKTQHLHGVEFGLEEKRPVVRNKQDVVDSINRFNDSELASRHGKVVIAE